MQTSALPSRSIAICSAWKVDRNDCGNRTHCEEFQFGQCDGSVRIWLSESLGSFSSVRNGLRMVFGFGSIPVSRRHLSRFTVNFSAAIKTFFIMYFILVWCFNSLSRQYVVLLKLWNSASPRWGITLSLKAASLDVSNLCRSCCWNNVRSCFKTALYRWSVVYKRLRHVWCTSGSPDVPVYLTHCMLLIWLSSQRGVSLTDLLAWRSQLQLDVHCLSCCGGDIWWTPRRKGRRAWCCLQVKLCDPCLSALCVPWCKKVLYKYSSFPFPLPSCLTKQPYICLQCFDTVTWASEKASGL